MHTISGSPFATLSSPLNRVARRLSRARRAAQPPPIASFAEFLQHHARVKTNSGYAPYHFAGREALREIVERLDSILAAGTADASLAICGGAQFGKTVLLLNLLAYLVAVRFRNVGYYLPDDDLVAGLVDGKLRPDVLDQIPWLAHLIAVGKTLTASGRAVHRKGAFLCTDGHRTALAWLRGLGKIPTSFSMDVVIQDEKDDLPERHARFLAGRMTASNLRLSLLIGTQRYHGAGQNLAFEEGTQHIGLLRCPACDARWNPETNWPGICRQRDPGLPPCEWPCLTPEGIFAQAAHANASSPTVLAERSAATSAERSAESYALACLACGTPLDRTRPEWQAQAPERVALHRYSYRVSQLLIGDIDLAQIVAAWRLAIRDPDQMNVFCIDRLALPQSSAQTLTPHDLQHARADYRLLPPGTMRSLPEPSSISHGPATSPAVGGLDLGDQCWFVARQLSPDRQTARLLWVEPIAAERVRTRMPELCRLLALQVLCVDAGPLRDLARDLTFALNGLHEDAIPSSRDPARNLTFTRGGETLPLRWHAETEKWSGLRALPVEFTQRSGQGIRHKIGRTQDDRLYPLLAAHRDESIARVIRELTAAHSADPLAISRKPPRPAFCSRCPTPPRTTHSPSTSATSLPARARNGAPMAAPCATSITAKIITCSPPPTPRSPSCFCPPATARSVPAPAPFTRTLIAPPGGSKADRLRSRSINFNPQSSF